MLLEGSQARVARRGFLPDPDEPGAPSCPTAKPRSPSSGTIRRMKKRLMAPHNRALLLAILSVACTNYQADKEAGKYDYLEKVRITENPLATTGCRYIAPVAWGRGMGSSKNSDAVIMGKMQEAAYNAGANVIFLGPNARRDDAIYGEAYSCPETPTPAATLTRVPG